MRDVQPDVNEVREALQQIKRGETDPEDVLERFSEVDGIERSVAIAVVKREQDMDEDFEDTFDADFSL